jgi:hypothetical protein
MTYAHSANRCVRFLRLVLAVTLARPDSSISVNELQRASPWTTEAGTPHRAQHQVPAAPGPHGAGLP